MRIIAKREELIPEYSTVGSGAFDLKCDIESLMIIKPNECLKIPTGLHMEIPTGYVGEISERSSSFIRGLLVRGKIDSDYRGEVFILVRNVSNRLLAIQPLQRIAQMQITPTNRVDIVPSLELSVTVRGDGGFGHTGK